MVVVVADVAEFNMDQFKKWNDESPENIIIKSFLELEDFLNGLLKTGNLFKISPKQRRLIQVYALCTFHNKEKIKDLEEYKKSKAES